MKFDPEHLPGRVDNGTKETSRNILIEHKINTQDSGYRFST